jgi:Ty3 transposon capsid-like protein
VEAQVPIAQPNQQVENFQAIDQAANTVNLKELLKLSKPFNGDSFELEGWIKTWKKIIPITCLSNESQIPQFISKMTGSAKNWFERLSASTEDNEEGEPWNINAYLKALETTFTCPHAQYKYMLDMMKMQQGTKIVAEYTDYLEDIISKAMPDMIEEKRVATFIRGLRPEIYHVINIQQAPKSLIEAISMTKAIEDGLSFKKTTGSVHFAEQNTSNSTVLAVLVDKISKLELENSKRNEDKKIPDRIKEEKLCHYCKKPNHFIRECGKRI